MSRAMSRASTLHVPAADRTPLAHIRAGCRRAPTRARVVQVAVLCGAARAWAEARLACSDRKPCASAAPPPPPLAAWRAAWARDGVYSLTCSTATFCTMPIACMPLSTYSVWPVTAPAMQSWQTGAEDGACTAGMAARRALGWD